MGRLLEWVDPLLLALAFAAGMFGAWLVGWRQGRRTTPETSADPGIKFTDAALALLGLLLAFTFSLSLTRHDQRRSMVIAESNAIGDFYTCASVLKDPHRAQLQGLLREYTERKLDAARDLRSESDLEPRILWFQQAHARMTAAVAAAVSDGTPIAVSLTNTLNEVTSNHAARLAAYRERLPWSIVALLFLGAVVPAYLMGLQQGTSARPHLAATVCFMFMVTLVVYVTLDLNQPGRGTITVSQEPLERLLQSMAGDSTSTAPASSGGTPR
jgi:hypothetical protein